MRGALSWCWRSQAFLWLVGAVEWTILIWAEFR